MGTTRQPARADNNIIKLATDNRKIFYNKMTKAVQGMINQFNDCLTTANIIVNQKFYFALNEGQ